MSLDQVEVIEKKRERKSMTRFTYDEGETKEMKVGSGKALGDLKELDDNFNDKKYADIILALHLLVFKSKGKAGQQKKKLKTFAGFVYDSEVDRLRYEERANKLKKGDVEKMMNFLKIDRSRASFDDNIPSKEMLVTRLIDYLEKPKSQISKPSATSHTKTKSKKVTKTKLTKLEEACLTAIGKKELDDDADLTGTALIKACESFLGIKLPAHAKSVVEDLVDDESEVASEDDEEPPKKKAKKNSSSSSSASSSSDDDDEDDANDENGQEEDSKKAAEDKDEDEAPPVDEADKEEEANEAKEEAVENAMDEDA